MNLLLLSLLPAFSGVALASPSVKIDAGVLHGGQCEDTQDAVYYKSVPYALPPVGDLRFEAPKDYNKKYSNGKLDATTPAPSCIQFSDTFAEHVNISEDCLYLDIWVPAKATPDSKLPVKVWVYGGSDTTGGISNSMYDGCKMAAEGAILVSVNYRLGPLGFMALNSAGIQGNQGIQDIVLGLEWVQSNIASFGGDPKQVLLFGQSAGAEDAFVVASLPQAPSLMNGMIAESGAGKYVALNSTLQRVGMSYARGLGCNTSDKSCLQSKTVKELLEAYNNDAYLSSGPGASGAIGIRTPASHSFYPYIDGNFITEEPVTHGVQVPSIFGFNSQEGTIYAGAQFILGDSEPTPAAYKKFLQQNFASAAPLVEKYYPLSLFKAYGEMAVPAAISQVITDADYKCIGYEGLLGAVRNGIPAWTYEFTHAPTCPFVEGSSPDTLEFLGPSHTAEIPYVFGNPGYNWHPNQTCKVSPAERKLSEQMMSLWTAMAGNADPSTDAIHWPEFEAARNFVTPGLIFGNSTVSGSVDYKACELWTKVYPMQAGSSATPTGTPSATPTPYTGGAAATRSTVWGLASLAGLFMTMTLFV